MIIKSASHIIYKIRLCSLAVASIILPVQYGWADTPSPTLIELQQSAIARSPQLSVRQATQAIAVAETELSESRWLPSITANINKTYGRRSGSFADSNSSSRRVNDSGKIGFSITQNLYDPSLDIDIKQAKLNTQSANFALEQTYDEITNRIVALFLDILATQAETNLLKGQQIAVNEQKKQAQISFDVGTVSITDVREAEAKYDRIAAQVAALQWQMRARQLELRTLTGYEINPSDYESSIQVLPDVSEKDLAEWLAAMKDENSQLKQAMIDYEVAMLEKEKLNYKYYPKVQLVVENNHNLGAWSDEGKEDYNSSKWDWSAGVQVQFSLFDSSTNTAQTAKALAVERQRLESMYASQEQLSIEIQQTFYKLLASISEYQGLYKADESAKTAFLANMLGYQVGMRINADVLDAQSKIYEVNRDRLIAWYESWRNYIKVNQIAGTLTPEQLIEIDTLLRQKDSSDAEDSIDD